MPASRPLPLELCCRPRRGPYLGLAAFFALTTPTGVAVGLGIRSTYNANSPAALATAGVFDSISTGILIYMALVRRTGITRKNHRRSLFRSSYAPAWTRYGGLQQKYRKAATQAEHLVGYRLLRDGGELPYMHATSGRPSDTAASACRQVDLIAVDFFGERMRNASTRQQLLAYVFLFLGAAVMCLLAKWA